MCLHIYTAANFKFYLPIYPYERQVPYLLQEADGADELRQHVAGLGQQLGRVAEALKRGRGSDEMRVTHGYVAATRGGEERTEAAAARIAAGTNCDAKKKKKDKRKTRCACVQLPFIYRP